MQPGLTFVLRNVLVRAATQSKPTPFDHRMCYLGIAAVPWSHKTVINVILLAASSSPVHLCFFRLTHVRRGRQQQQLLPRSYQRRLQVHLFGRHIHVRPSAFSELLLVLRHSSDTAQHFAHRSRPVQYPRTCHAKGPHHISEGLPCLCRRSFVCDVLSKGLVEYCIYLEQLEALSYQSPWLGGSWWSVYVLQAYATVYRYGCTHLFLMRLI